MAEELLKAIEKFIDAKIELAANKSVFADESPVCYMRQVLLSEIKGALGEP